MKSCAAGSISGLKSRSFGKFGVKLLKLPEGWPVSVFYENIYKNGRDVPFVIHKRTAEFVYVLNGTAKACLGNKSFNVRSGDYLVVPPGVKHRFLTGKKPMLALSMFYPPMDWNRLDAVICGSAGDKKRNSPANLKRRL